MKVVDSKVSMDGVSIYQLFLIGDTYVLTELRMKDHSSSASYVSFQARLNNYEAANRAFIQLGVLKPTDVVCPSCGSFSIKRKYPTLDSSLSGDWQVFCYDCQKMEVFQSEEIEHQGVGLKITYYGIEEKS